MSRNCPIWVVIVLLALLRSADAGTLNYSNQSTQTFSFSQISEVSAQSYYLGTSSSVWPPSSMSATPFRAFRGLDGYHSLELDPGSSLALSASSPGWTNTASTSASTRLSLKVSSLSPTDEIFGFRLRLEGIAILSENSPIADANASIQGMLDLNLFGPNGSWGSSYNINLTPLNVTTPGMNRWQMEWTQANLKSWIQDTAFDPATMKISELSLQFTPFFSLSTYDKATSELYVNQLQIAVIPEPSTVSLVLLGGVILLGHRRRFA